MEVYPNSNESLAQSPSMLARLSHALSNGYEHLQQHATRYVALGAAALTVAGGAKLAADPESVDAAHRPITDPITRTCIKEGTSPDATRVLLAKLDEPGQANQAYIIKVHINGLDPRCKNRVQRVASIRPEMQNPLYPGKWLNKELPKWQTLYTRNVGGVFGTIDFNHKIKPTQYRATPGPGVTRARFKERIQMKNLRTKEVLKQVIRIHPVTIEGGQR